MNEDFEVYMGDSVDLIITIKKRDNTPQSLVGATVRWMMSASQEGTPLLLKTNASNAQITTADNIATVKLTSSDLNRAAGSYFHYTEVILPDGKKGTVTVGRITIRSKPTAP